MTMTIILIARVWAPYRFFCAACDRTAVGYATEAAAQYDADGHDCTRPRRNELDPAQMADYDARCDANR